MSNLGTPQTLYRCCICDGTVNEFERQPIEQGWAHATCVDDPWQGGTLR